MKKIVSLIVIALVNYSFAAGYYSTSTENELLFGQLLDDSLKSYIKEAARRNFHPLGYKKGSKREIFGHTDLERDDEGYFIKDVYCNQKIRNRVGPNKMPNNNIMNIEHTWPQSKGAKREPAKGDLHHLFPTDSRANSTRGNHPFGEVIGEDINHNCTASQKGKIISPTTGVSSGIHGYQPPLEHRGDVARAMFYVSAFYKYRISSLEEFYLRKWHEEDPVDFKESNRNNSIELAQGNRNPFVDFPELVNRISDF